MYLCCQSKLLQKARVIPVLGAALVPYIRDSPLARLIVSSIACLSKMGVYVVIYIHIILFFGGSGEAAVFLLYLLCAQFLDLRTHYGHTSCCFWSCERISGK